MNELINHQWYIEHCFYYLALGLLSSIAIRVVLALFSASHLKHVERVPWYTGFSGSVLGWIETTNEKVRARSDYSLPFWLGLLELYAYPVLIATNALPVIGAWIGFKAVAQWGGWKEQRVTFNRFLLGNVLVVCVAYFLSKYVITRP